MAHQMPKKVQKEIKAIPGNNVCVDCETRNPQWASVSYGTLFCLDCSGQHRSLGVHLSFVRSIQMDSWSDPQLEVMRNGGNSKLLDYFSARGISKETPIKEKYDNEIAELYRLIVIARRDGTEIPTKVPEKPKNTNNNRKKNRKPEDKGYKSVEEQLAEREAARARLKEKFGGKGLSGNSLSSHPMPTSVDDSGGERVSEMFSGLEKKDDPLAAFSSAFGDLTTKAAEATRKAADSLKKSDALKQAQSDLAPVADSFSKGVTNLWSSVSSGFAGFGGGSSGAASANSSNAQSRGGGAQYERAPLTAEDAWLESQQEDEYKERTKKPKKKKPATAKPKKKVVVVEEDDDDDADFFAEFGMDD